MSYSLGRREGLDGVIVRDRVSDWMELLSGIE